MMILTKIGQRENLVTLLAYHGGVFCFEYFGDASYLDPHDDTVWDWIGTDLSIIEILGVLQDDGVALNTSSTPADCESLAGSFHWDDLTGILYVHWRLSVGDHSIYREIANYSGLIAGYTDKYHWHTNNTFDGFFYSQMLIGLGGLQKKVDPMKLGLVSFEKSSYTVSNEDGRFDDITETAVVGVPVWFYDVPDDVDTLTDEMRIFTGYLNGYKNDRDSITFDVVESRYYENKPTCPNAVNTTDYPDCGDQEGKLLPVAFGDIRRGIMVPVDLGAITDPPAVPTIVTFVVADPALGSVLGIDHVYDEFDNEYTILAVNLPDNEVTVSSAAWGGGVAEFVDFNFDEWRWEGQGYDIAGTYDNGLDIIRAVFLLLSNVPYIATTYDQIKWAAETAANTQKIGISAQTDKGYIEEIVEPIVTSLQGVLDILGDGRISYESRDTDAPPVAIVEAWDQLDEPEIDVDTANTVSEISIQYAPDFTDRDKKYLSYIYTDDRDMVIARYGINRRDPISPVKSVLFEAAAAEELAGLLMETSSSPDRAISFESTDFIPEARVFDIVGLDTGKHGERALEFGEILRVDPDYLKRYSKFSVRIIDDYDYTDVVIAAPELVSAMCYGVGAVVLRIGYLTDADSYRIYYTDNPLDWDQNSVDYPQPFTIGPLNTVLYDLTGLDGDTVYYFRVRAIDADGHESDYSNVEFCYVWGAGDAYLNRYRTDGDFVTGFELDQGNALGGAPLAAWALYDGTHLYNGLTNYWPASVYESGLCFHPNGFQHIAWASDGDAGDIYFQYRYYAGGVWSAWSVPLDAVANLDFDFPVAYNYIHYRFFFQSSYWFDDDYFRLTELS